MMPNNWSARSPISAFPRGLPETPFEKPGPRRRLLRCCSAVATSIAANMGTKLGTCDLPPIPPATSISDGGVMLRQHPRTNACGKIIYSTYPTHCVEGVSTPSARSILIDQNRHRNFSAAEVMMSAAACFFSRATTAHTAHDSALSQ
jgi:hypothetical protein